MAKRGVWVEKLETRAWNRELVWATYASPGRPRWLGSTLAAWLRLGDAGAAHRHGLGCDFGYNFSQMTKMCIRLRFLPNYENVIVTPRAEKHAQLFDYPGKAKRLWLCVHRRLDYVD